MPKRIEKDHEVSTLHRELQTTKGSLEQKKSSSSGKSIPWLLNTKMIILENSHTSNKQVVFCIVYVYAHTQQQLMKKEAMYLKEQGGFAGRKGKGKII